MVNQQDIINELKKYPNGILQTELAREVGYLKEKKKYSSSYNNQIMSLLKGKLIIREKTKNSRFMVFLNKENNKGDKT